MAEEKVIGYCVKCKAKREMTDPKIVVFPNKRKAYKGKCIKCQTTMVRILTKEEAGKEGEKK